MEEESTSKSKKNTRSRSWCFTWNNWTEEEWNPILSKFKENWKGIQYAIFGYEAGSEKETPHIQGYIQYHNARYFNAMKKILPKAHFESSRGTPYENFQYCSKEGKFIEIGDRPSDGPKRTDINAIRDLVKSGRATRADIYEIASGYQAQRFGEIGLELYTIKRTWIPQIWWIYGPTGTGKSHFAHAMTNESDRWESGQVVNNFIFAGYKGQEDVILDDFRPQHMPFSLLLRVLDRYPLQVRTIGGNVQFLAKRIFITTTRHPTDFYRDLEDEAIDQLLRRIEDSNGGIIHKTQRYKPPVPNYEDPPVNAIAEQDRHMAHLSGVILDPERHDQ